MAIGGGFRLKALARLTVLSLVAATIGLAAPAQAQFSESYRFLEAVKKKDGAKVEEALSEPGSTIINTRDFTSGETALHIVTARRDMTWVRYLVSKGANVNLRDGRGQSPLQLASNLGWIDGVQFLVENRADLDQPNDTGETPLISAVHRKNVELMRILLRGGADPDRADNSGRSARDYAQLEGAGSVIATTLTQLAKPKGAVKRPAQGPVYGPTF